MANPNRKMDVIIKILPDRIGRFALVYEGWPNQKHVKDLRRMRGLLDDWDIPEISITEFNYWPDHLNINVWAKSGRERDETSRMVTDVHGQIEKEHKIGMTIRARDITFEEKGKIRPGKWDIIEGSNPTFRKLIQVDIIDASCL